jgi:hypothetical protein
MFIPCMYHTFKNLIISCSCWCLHVHGQHHSHWWLPTGGTLAQTQKHGRVLNGLHNDSNVPFVQLENGRRPKRVAGCRVPDEHWELLDNQRNRELDHGLRSPAMIFTTLDCLSGALGCTKYAALGCPLIVVCNIQGQPFYTIFCSVDVFMSSDS